MRSSSLTVAAATVITVCLAVGPPVAAANDLWTERYASIDLGGMASEAELEDFLRTAEVVKIEDIGEGITKPRRVTLQRDGKQCRAIFKTVDESNTDIAYTNRFETVFSDRYVYEVAAYRVDRLLDIGLVPTTVVREIDGEVGSLQFWIEDAIKIQDAHDQDLPVGDLDLLLQRLMLMYVLDAMIYNIDRNFTNILVRPMRDEFFLIDHSRAFRVKKKLPPDKEERDIPIPERVARRLRHLDYDSVQAALGDLLSKRQIRAVDRRRQLVLAELEQRGVLPDTGLTERPNLSGRIRCAGTTPR